MSERIEIRGMQRELEAFFERHLHFQSFDGPNSEWNLATALAAEGECLSQAIHRMVDQGGVPSRPQD